MSFQFDRGALEMIEERVGPLPLKLTLLSIPVIVILSAVVIAGVAWNTVAWPLAVNIVAAFDKEFTREKGLVLLAAIGISAFIFLVGVVLLNRFAASLRTQGETKLRSLVDAELARAAVELDRMYERNGAALAEGKAILAEANSRLTEVMAIRSEIENKQQGES